MRRHRPLRTIAVTVAVLAGTAWPVAGAAETACAAEGPRAGLVVDTGARVTALCVQLDAAEVSGLHLIELAADQHGLAYGFGLGGAAVCHLAGVGPAGSDCFSRYPDFWGYWHGTGGGWTWASTGAGSHRVGDGDIDGWVWGAGDTGTTHDRPPTTRFADLCREAPPIPTPDPTEAPSTPKPGATASETTEPGGDGTRSGGSGGSQPSEGGDGGVAGGTAPTRSPGSAATSTATASVPSSAGSSLAAAATDQGRGGAGPPVGLLLAGGLGAALVLGGVMRTRSRNARDTAARPRGRARGSP